MRFSIVAAVFASAVAVSATTINVTVGANGALAYQPTSVNASINDVVSFTFMGGNHSATQSTFTAPCQKMANGIDSGFVPTTAGASQLSQWSITVNTTSPIWFYCRQTGHCSKGMVFAINPTADKTFAAFQAAAEGSSTNTSSATSSASGTTSTGTGTATGASASHTGGAMQMRGGNGAGFLTVVVGLVMGFVA